MLYIQTHTHDAMDNKIFKKLYSKEKEKAFLIEMGFGKMETLNEKWFVYKTEKEYHLLPSRFFFYLLSKIEQLKKLFSEATQKGRAKFAALFFFCRVKKKFLPDFKCSAYSLKIFILKHVN